MAQNSQIATPSPLRTSRRRCKCVEEAFCPHGTYPRSQPAKPQIESRGQSEEHRERREEVGEGWEQVERERERVLASVEKTKVAIDREISAYIEELVALGEVKKRAVDAAAEEQLIKLKAQSSSRCHISPMANQTQGSRLTHISVCFGKLPLNSLISFPTAREETVAFGAQPTAGLYNYKGRFSHEARHSLSLCLSKDVILTAVNIAAVFTKATLSSFAIFSGNQSLKNEIYRHNSAVNLQPAGEYAIKVELKQGVSIRAGEVITLKAEVTAEQCYSITYYPVSHYYQTSPGNVGVYIMPSANKTADSRNEGIFYGFSFRLA